MHRNTDNLLSLLGWFLLHKWHAFQAQHSLFILASVIWWSFYQMQHNMNDFLIQQLDRLICHRFYITYIWSITSNNNKAVLYDLETYLCIVQNVIFSLVFPFRTEKSSSFFRFSLQFLSRFLTKVLSGQHLVIFLRHKFFLPTF